MSYILAALKKADEEHFLGSVPDLATPQEVEPVKHRSYRWHWVILALLIVNAVLVVMLLKDNDAEVTGTPVAEQVQAPSEPQPPLVNELETTREAHPVPQTSEPRIGETPTPEKTASPPVEPIHPKGEVVVLPGPARSQNSEPLVLTNQNLDMQVDNLTTTNADPQVRNWFDLPAQFRNRIDLPRLDVHVYSEDPQGRFILVNLKKYREGDTLPNGLVLEQILPYGLEMSYQGEQFRVAK